jgi:hypothetical protein
VINWSVRMTPAEGHDASGESIAGVIVGLWDGNDDHIYEVCRVAFNRRITANPEDAFEAVLEREIAKAQVAADAMNDALDAFDREQSEAQLKWRAKMRELLGEPAGVV